MTGCCKQAWAEMTDSELEDRLFTYLFFGSRSTLQTLTPGRVAQLIDEAERRGQHGMLERARAKAETTPAATEPDTLES
jgi:hypothetical protein